MEDEGADVEGSNFAGERHRGGPLAALINRRKSFPRSSRYAAGGRTRGGRVEAPSSVDAASPGAARCGGAWTPGGGRPCATDRLAQPFPEPACARACLAGRGSRRGRRWGGVQQHEHRGAPHQPRLPPTLASERLMGAAGPHGVGGPGVSPHSSSVSPDAAATPSGDAPPFRHTRPRTPKLVCMRPPLRCAPTACLARRRPSLSVPASRRFRGVLSLMLHAISGLAPPLESAICVRSIAQGSHHGFFCIVYSLHVTQASRGALFVTFCTQRSEAVSSLECSLTGLASILSTALPCRTCLMPASHVLVRPSCARFSRVASSAAFCDGKRWLLLVATLIERAVARGDGEAEAGLGGC